MDRHPTLRADCARCVGLCCVAPAFVASADFAIDKPAGQPCPNLLADCRCSIHDTLRENGFAGCTVYDCFGSGQHVVQATFGGRSWQEGPDVAEQMFACFAVMRDLHELLWYLQDALERPAAQRVHRRIIRCRDDLEQLTGLAAAELAVVDTGELQRRVAPLLTETSELVRGGAAVAPGAGGKPAGRPANLLGQDLFGRDLRDADLVGANLRGAYLIRAVLQGADLRLADLLGADLRGADVSGADLSTALFLTQFQVNATRGDGGTRLPQTLDRPTHWAG